MPYHFDECIKFEIIKSFDFVYGYMFKKSKKVQTAGRVLL